MRTIFLLIPVAFSIATSAQNVTLSWQRIDSSLTDANSEFNTLITDGNNAVYATGYRESALTLEESIILKYSDNGTFQWTDGFGVAPNAGWHNNINEGKVLKLTPTGNIILGSDTREYGDHFELRSYTTEGDLNWDLVGGTIQSASNAFGSLADITVLPDNSIALFANLNYANGQGLTYSVFKISGSGQSIWSGTYSANSAHDLGAAIEHDPLGILYFTGGVFNFDNGSYDFTTLNLHPNGSNDWIARFNHLTGLKDIAYDMVVDNDQNQFITGISEITTDETDMSTIMQNVYGTRLWEDLYGGSAGASDTAIAVVTDNSQNSIVLGTTVEDTLGSFLNAITLIRYNVDGERMWVKKFLGDDNLGGKATGITIHPSGNVYITGVVGSNSSGRNILVACIEPSGNTLWEYTYDGSDGLDDHSNDIAVTEDHKIYIVGSTTTASAKKHLVFKLDELVTSTHEELTDDTSFEISSSYYDAGQLNIAYRSTISSPMKLSLFDAAGRQIASTVSEVDKGTGIITIGSYLSAGLYVYRVSNGDIYKTGKIHCY